MTMEKRPTLRRPVSGGELGKNLDQRLLSHLPATVTMRRPQSPTRRSDSVKTTHSPGQTDDTPVVSSGETLPNKFFLASDASQAARTPTTTQKKPAFFTANSFSDTSKTASPAPEFRRAESANELRPRSASRPVARRTPTIRDPSPHRQSVVSSKLRPAVVPKLAGAGVSAQDSPSPFTNVRAMPGRVQTGLRDDCDETPSKPPVQTDPRLQRQKSTASIRTVDRTSSKSLESVPVIKSPAKDRSLRQQKRFSDSAASASSALDGAEFSEHNALSPQSLASTATSTSQHQNDYFDTAMNQPAQTNRKIMDLEIRTTSLLAVNTQLERQSRKQAAEMKELRRKLAHAMKYPSSAIDQLPSDAGALDGDTSIDDHVEGQDDLQEVGNSLLRAATLVDHSIKRALLLSEQLLHDANRGLHYRPRESEIGIGVLRVLQNSTPDITREDDSSFQSNSIKDGQYKPGNILDDADISGLDLT